MTFSKLQSEALWTFCLGIANGTTLGISEKILRSISQTLGYNLSDLQIRQLLDWLESHQYCQIDRTDTANWTAIGTEALVQLVNFDNDCPAEIARPMGFGHLLHLQEQAKAQKV